MSIQKYAKLNNDNEVIQVIVLNEDEVGDMATLTQLTLGKLRKVTNNAGLGYVFNTTLNEFVPPKPFPSWVLNNSTLEWESPLGDAPELTDTETVINDDGYILSGYRWDEDAYQADNTTGWVLETPE